MKSRRRVNSTVIWLLSLSKAEHVDASIHIARDTFDSRRVYARDAAGQFASTRQDCAVRQED
jgi:hypothetical protein